MYKRIGAIIVSIIVIAIFSITVWYLHTTHLALLDPAGLIAQKEKDLIVLVTALSMIIIVPVFALTIFVVWKYREGNINAQHSPDWDYKPIVDVIWWTIPAILIVFISIIIWKSTYELDPYKSISVKNQSGNQVAPLVIQVVAMDWKWLFIYPKQGIATINFFQFPKDVPVDFEITSDAPMNSFWIPELGGQIYAMPSMSTNIHSIASSTGSYPGVSANISGAGFSGMTFIAKSTSQSDFNSWVTSVQNSNNPLSIDAYNELAKPSSYNKVALYSSSTPNIYGKIIMKDMMQAKEVSDNMSENTK